MSLPPIPDVVLVGKPRVKREWRLHEANYIRELIEKEIGAGGSQKEWAESRGVSQQYLCDVLHGSREPGRKILDAIGFERVVLYRMKESA